MNSIIKNLLNISREKHHTLNNMRNGRVDIMNKQLQSIPLFEQKNTGNTEYKCNAVSNILELTPLQLVFFGKDNIDRLQELIRKNVYIQSHQKHIIQNQSNTDLKIVMRSIYLQYSKNLNSHVNEQVGILNQLVLEYCVPNILSNLELFLHYKKSVSNLPDSRLPNPVYTSSAGTRTNPNWIY